MEVKAFEILDRVTAIQAIAIRLRPDSEAERLLLRDAGYGSSWEQQGDHIILIDVQSMMAQNDPYRWPVALVGRTMQVAHRALSREDPNLRTGYGFDDLPSGAVIDVQFLLGETAAPRASEYATD